MKKICLMLCIIVIVFAFSACQNNTSSDNNTNGLESHKKDIRENTDNAGSYYFAVALVSGDGGFV